MITWIRLALPVALVVAGCSLYTPGNPGDVPSGDITDPIPIAPDCRGRYPDDSFTLEDARMDGDLLVLRVSYSGGCTDHDFFVCWQDGTFLESDPVQARLVVSHDAHDDMCQAYVTEDRYVDVRTLRGAYQRSYGSDGIIIIRIAGTEHTIEYQL